MIQYYIHDGNIQKGPFSLEELKNQNISSDTLIWYEGMSEWKKASQIEDIQFFFKQVPPLPVIAPPPIPSEIIQKKRYFPPVYFIGGIVVLLLIIGYLFFQNSKHQDEIANVKNAIEQKNIEIENQRLLQQKKEADEQSAVAALRAKQIMYRNSWKKYVILSSSKYLTSGLGGISDLDLTVSNYTEYPLDNVEVQVDYIKANGGVYKTEKVVYDVIPAGTQKTLPAPYSDRGTSVNIRIQKVKASGFHFCYDYDYRMEGDKHGTTTSPNGISGNPADPWKCN